MENRPLAPAATPFDAGAGTVAARAWERARHGGHVSVGARAADREGRLHGGQHRPSGQCGADGVDGEGRHPRQVGDGAPADAPSLARAGTAGGEDRLGMVSTLRAKGAILTWQHKSITPAPRMSGKTVRFQ